MPANYVLLQKTTLSAGAASVTFSSIPQTGYTDLKLVISSRDARATLAVSDIWFNFNGTGTGTNISGFYLYGNGSSAPSTNITGNGELAFGSGNGATANMFGNAEVYIPNYSSTTAFKPVLSDSVAETNGTQAFQLFLAGLWSNNAAIHTISMTPFTSPFAANSEFSLYGIAAKGVTPVIAPYATGGDTITNDGTFWYHTFLSSGVFAPNRNLTCDYLVVAGGGGGGVSGAGAGGLRSTVTATGGGGSVESPLNLAAQGYPVTVGAGGAGSPDGQTTAGSQGSNSVLHTITSLGGARGIKDINPTRADGFSGGSGSGGFVGGALTSPGVGIGGAGTTGQGYAGGNSGPHSGASSSGGGGGGAGATGGTPSTANTNAPGGNGVAVAISGSSVTYAGGGGSGIYGSGTAAAGGTGGGGSGATQSQAGSSGTANTGGGGGAAYSDAYRYASYSGGSGIVIIRYPIA